MRIGIDVLFWIPNAMGGSQTYSGELIRALAELDGGDEYVVFLNADGARRFVPPSPRFRVQVCPIPGRFRPLRVLWQHLILPVQVRRLGIDVLHSLGYMGPLAVPTKQVVTVLDMVHYLFPQDIEPPKRHLWRALFPLSLWRADRVITFSESVRQEVGRFFPWALAKTVVIPLAVDRSLFNPGPTGAARGRPGGRPFLLAVATMSRHKNLDRLVVAYAQVRRVYPDLQLILAGLMRPWQREGLEQRIRALGLEGHVVLAGWVSSEELVRLYRTAEALVFPSLYEGFGFPPLEAMACGCPVVASNASAVPEVSGGAAVFFDPEDEGDMARAILAVLSSPNERERLVRLGLERALEYTWQETAARTYEVYRSCYQKPGQGARP